MNLNNFISFFFRSPPVSTMGPSPALVTIVSHNNQTRITTSGVGNPQNGIKRNNGNCKTRIIRLRRDGTGPLGFSIRGGEK